MIWLLSKAESKELTSPDQVSGFFLFLSTTRETNAPIANKIRMYGKSVLNILLFGC